MFQAVSSFMFTEDIELPIGPAKADESVVQLGPMPSTASPMNNRGSEQHILEEMYEHGDRTGQQPELCNTNVIFLQITPPTGSNKLQRLS